MVDPLIPLVKWGDSHSHARGGIHTSNVNDKVDLKLDVILVVVNLLLFETSCDTRCGQSITKWYGYKLCKGYRGAPYTTCPWGNIYTC